MATTDDDAFDFEVEGDVIRFMWDYGVTVPLWTGTGLVPDDPRWLRAALGLSDELIADLTAWGNAMNDLDADVSLRTPEAYADMDRRAQELVERVRRELGSRFGVVYRAW